MESTRSEDAPAARPSPSPPSASSPRSSANTQPFPGHVFRRSVTVQEAPPLRPRPISLASLPSSDNGDSPGPGLRRRSSTMSEFNLHDAGKFFRDGTRNLLDPGAARSEQANDASSLLSSLPLAFALFPAIAGVFFEGGRDLISDVMLLGLVFIFLRFTIIHPWQWYRDAQAVRVTQELPPDQIFDDGSEAYLATNMTASTSTLDGAPGEHPQHHEGGAHKGGDVPEHEHGDAKITDEKKSRSRSREAAINELYVHEVLALLSCFLSPVLGAYLLHAVRAQLSLPSEGLLTDFNITVFLLAAEFRPISHTLKLVQARTLHLQRIVQATPVEPSLMAKYENMCNRVAQLEQRAAAAEEATSATLVANAAKQAQQKAGGARGNKPDAALVREVRNAIQPELDALNRAVRRYETKATVLALQTESRFGSVDTKVQDAISLAAAASELRNNSHGGLFSLLAWVLNGLLYIATMPYHVTKYMVMLPFRTFTKLWFRSSRSTRDRQSGPARPGRHSSSRGPRYGSGSDKDRYRDRMPSRLSRRYSP